MHEGVNALTLDEHANNFLLEQHAIGKKYHIEEYYLRKFLSYRDNHLPKATGLSRDLVMSWAEKSPVESEPTQRFRVSPVRQFALYLSRVGVDNAYILPAQYVLHKTQFIPHIYTDHEVIEFMKQVDQCKEFHAFPNKPEILSLLFRLLYCCGLRISEALALQQNDIDLQNGVLTIRQSKNGSERLVPMSVSLTNRMRHYIDIMEDRYTHGDNYIFHIHGKIISYCAIYGNFRNFLRMAGISHCGRGKGPRIHDFRHTFAVHCLRKWVREGKNMNAYYPVLSAYMGHSAFKDTQYYLHLTVDMYPEIISRVEDYLGDIIPVLGGTEDE